MTTACFRCGIVLEGLDHEATDEVDDFVVVVLDVGRLQGSIILVEEDVNRFTVGPVEPFRENQDGFSALAL